MLLSKGSFVENLKPTKFGRVVETSTTNLSSFISFVIAERKNDLCHAQEDPFLLFSGAFIGGATLVFMLLHNKR